MSDESDLDMDDDGLKVLGPSDYISWDHEPFEPGMVADAVTESVPKSPARLQVEAATRRAQQAIMIAAAKKRAEKQAKLSGT